MFILLSMQIMMSALHTLRITVCKVCTAMGVVG